jgi:molecular chaperone GrpE (heat shock protein)
VGFTVMISMPAMIVPFERLSLKHKNNTTYRGLEAIVEQLYQMLSENGIEALYDDREETQWDSIKIDIR